MGDKIFSKNVICYLKLISVLFFCLEYWLRDRLWCWCGKVCGNLLWYLWKNISLLLICLWKPPFGPPVNGPLPKLWFKIGNDIAPIWLVCFCKLWWCIGVCPKVFDRMKPANIHLLFSIQNDTTVGEINKNTVGEETKKKKNPSVTKMSVNTRSKM